jgi:2-oxoglutarate ferredoxin oxidoreductase subunit alpha
MLGKVIIPPASAIEVTERKLTSRPAGEYMPFRVYAGDIPEMAAFGMGLNMHVTGLTHDERGYPAMNAEAQDKLVRRLCGKILDHVEDISIFEADQVEGSDVTVIAYGITAAVASYAVKLARDLGLKVGMVRLTTLWPFNDRLIRDVAAGTKAVLVAELNLGQMVHEVRRACEGKVPVHFAGHAGGGIIEPEVLLEKIREAAR